MNIKRFHAPTSREALAKARMAFGEGTLILSNRPIAGGVEVVATAEDALGALEHGSAQAAPEQEQQQTPERQAAAAPRAPASPVQEDTEQLAMSTLSFQDYVRERMLRRRHEAMHGGRAEAPPPARQPPRSASFSERVAHQDRAPAAAPPRHNPLLQAPPQPLPAARPAPVQPSPLAFATTAPAPAPMRHALPAEFIGEPAPPRRRAAAAPVAAAPAISEQALLGELQSMRDLIEDRFSTLTWLGQARQDPIQSNLMLKLIRAGYSPALARAVLERLPEDLSAADAVRWLMEVLERNLRTDAPERPLWEQGGIFALVGATGVGKTTTAAKLAALCARVHGPASVGLITLDTYRVAAHEQLRTDLAPDLRTPI
ncbi:MAG: Flagellar biosynthesis protein FlhF [Xylophilus sp.]|nr:MAG: Flagellar biosynthesis protein FlhF [Xylophilus sp.]